MNSFHNYSKALLIQSKYQWESNENHVLTFFKVYFSKSRSFFWYIFFQYIIKIYCMVFFYPQNPLLYHIDNYYQSDVYYSRCIIRKWKYTYILLPKYTYTYINTNIHILVPYRESTSMIHGGSLRLHNIIFTSRGFANWDQSFWQQSLSMQPSPSEISWQKKIKWASLVESTPHVLSHNDARKVNTVYDSTGRG